MNREPMNAYSSVEHRGRAVIRGGILSGAAILFSTAAMLAVGKMVTNRLGQTEVALFSLLLLWADFFNVAGGLGLPVSLPKLIGAASEGRRRTIAGSCVRWQCRVFATFTLVWWLLLGAGWLLGIGVEYWRPYVTILVFLPLLSAAGAFRDGAMAALAGFGLYGPRAIGIAVSSLAQILLVFFCLWVMHCGIGILAAVMVAAAATAAVWLFLSFPEGARWNARPDAAKECVRFSLPLYANSLLGFVFQRFDTMLIVLFLQSAPAVALYEMAKRIPVLLSRLLGATAVPFLPTLSGMLGQHQEKEAARFLARATGLVAFLGYAGVLSIVLVQEWLLILLFNREYLAAAPVLGLLAAAAAIGVQAGLMGQTLIALGKPGWVTSANVATALINVAANAVLLPIFGLMGAAIAAAGAAFFSLAAQTWCVRRNGLHVLWAAWALPQVFMMAAGGTIWLGHAAPAARLIALGLFLAGCFATRVIAISDLWKLVRAFRAPRGQV